MSDPSIEWVVLELTTKAEGEDPDVIRASIRHHIRDAEVFIPASVVQQGGNRVYQYLVDGYAFIRNKHPSNLYRRLDDTKYVQNVLYVRVNKDKKLATITADQVEKLRSQIKVEVDQGIEVGDTIVITSGPYKNISAIVKEDIQEQDSVLVHIKLRSTDRLITLPRGFLRLETKSPTIVYRDRFQSISDWTRSAHYLMAWTPRGLGRLPDASQKFFTLTAWLNRSVSTYELLRSYYATLDFVNVLSKATDYGLLHRGATLRARMSSIHALATSSLAMTARQLEFLYLTDVVGRVAGAYSELKAMTERPEAPVNLIVDGTQLFIRCSEAPGLGSLTDSTGRPTGAIVGFLRSLGGYKKRFPKAVVYVCWDGSSQRRKNMYPEYKANRSSRSNPSQPGSLPFGWGWLREALPLLGVFQAFNHVEEADDVMASLVRGPLLGQPNVMITTDRDLLQLVTEFTHQLCPAVGAGKEKLYDLDLVKEEYGVKPPTLVHVRALSGDSSDNISGVPNFGLKTASKLISMHGSVGALLSSNLAGLTKSQVANLLASEKQVRLNVELLTLCDVPYEQIESNPDQIEVEARLKALEIKPDPILAAFFPRI
jgi:5'-3' exonuclease/transcription antitermination factor NusG